MKCGEKAEMMAEKKKRHHLCKWDKKAGLISKTYKVSGKTAGLFQETCKRLDIPVGPTLTRLMEQFISEHKEQ